MGIFQVLSFIFFILLFTLAVVYAITFLLHRRHAHKIYQEVEKLHKNLVDLISAHNEIVDVLEQIWKDGVTSQAIDPYSLRRSLIEEEENKKQ